MDKSSPLTRRGPTTIARSLRSPLIVALACRITQTTAAPFVGALTPITAALRDEHALAGLSWHDCRYVAGAIAYDVAARRDAAAHLAARARKARDNDDGVDWDDHHGAARALNIAATVIGL